MKIIHSFLILTFTLVFIGCNSPNDKLSTLQGAVFRTTYTITYFNSSHPIDEIAGGIDSIFSAVNASVITYATEGFPKTNTP